MADAMETVMSKSAKRRERAKKAGAGEEEAAPAAPAPAPVAPKAEAKGKAKAAAAPAKAAAAAPAPAPAAEAKAKAKGKAKAEPKAAAAPEPAAKAGAKSKAAQSAPAAPTSKAGAKSKAQPEAPAAATSKAKGKSKAKEEPAPPPEPEDPFVVYDDGTGDAWEAVAVVTKTKKKKDDSGAAAAPAKAAASAGYPTAAPRGGAKGGGKGSYSAANTSEERQAALQAKIAQIKAESAAEAAAKMAPQAAAIPADQPHVTINIPEKKLGIVIGPKGKTLKYIQEKTGVTRIDTFGETATIVGEDMEAVTKAETAIKELIEKGYMSMAYDDYKQDFVTVQERYLPDLIGTRGATIIKIKEELSVEVNIPEGARKPAGAFGEEKEKKPEAKVKVSLAGEAVNVAKAKEVIESIIMKGCHPVTHPGQIAEEMDIDPENYRYIIGRAGSEMKHIQKNFRVKVVIPKEGSLNSKVVIVGEEADVPRAVKYIKKTIEGMAEENEKRDKERAERGDKPPSKDKWEDKEEYVEESWMKRHMASSSSMFKK